MNKNELIIDGLYPEFSFDTQVFYYDQLIH